MLLALILISLSLTSLPIERIAVQVDSVKVAAYAANLSADLPLLVLLHGSPGDWTAMRKYLEDSSIQQKYRIISITRPGYGESDSSQAYPDLRFQGSVLHAFISKYATQKPVTILCHSLGGAIAMRYALDYPNEVQNMILLAPTVSKHAERPKFYNHLAKIPWINKRLRHEMQISNVEMLQLPAQLDQMELEYPTIKANIWLFHGKMDMIAPYENARLLLKTIPKHLLTFTMYRTQNHFIPWTKFEDIKALLLTELVKS